MPRTQTALAVCLVWLLASAQASAQAPQAVQPPQGNWPPAAYQRRIEGVQQAGYTAPLLTAAVPPSPAPNNLDSVPLSSPQQKSISSLPLAPRGKTNAANSGSNAGNAILTTAGSLAVVLCLFFAVAWVLRRGTPNSLTALPVDVVEILGRASLPGRHQMHLIRCGHKLLLVAVSTAGADTLTEITDPLEVDRLCGLCRQTNPQSATASFRNILDQLGAEPASARKPRFARAIEDADA